MNVGSKPILNPRGMTEASSWRIYSAPEPRFPPLNAKIICGRGFCGADQSYSIQRGLIYIKDKDAVLIESDAPQLPGVFFALVDVLPIAAEIIVIGGDPLFDGPPGWLHGLGGVDLFEY